jgi:hypothetical protein
MDPFPLCAGGSSHFPYKALADLDAARIEAHCNSVRQQFHEQTQLPNAHEEWIFRTFTAVKLILSATVMLSSAKYAAAKGLRIVEPYLLYYALFNTSRALVMIVPGQNLNDGKLLEATHSKIRNVTSDELRHLSKEFAAEYQDLVERALVSRELFSYKFPATGLSGQISESFPSFSQVIKVCRYIAEVAQLNSECLERAFSQLGRPNGDFSEELLRRIFEHEHKLLPIPLHDDEDYYRLGRTLIKLGRPVSLQMTATEGLVEDFFGAWDFSEYQGEGQIEMYRPEMVDWDLIFEFS